MAPRESKRMSVEQLHVLHCSRLADAAQSTPPGAEKRGNSRPPADIDWEWAAQRACKLAGTMRPADMAACATAFSRAGRRDVRLFFTLAEAALPKKLAFGVGEAAEMLRAFAAARVRNEPLFEALGGRLVDLAEEEGSPGDGAQQEEGRASGSAEAGALPDTAVALAHALVAHADLGFIGLPSFRPLAAQIAAESMATRLPPDVSKEVREALERAADKAQHQH